MLFQILCLAGVLGITNGYNGRYDQRPSSTSTFSPFLDEFLRQNPETDLFFNLIRKNQYINTTLHWKSNTIFVPINSAIEEYLRMHQGRIDDSTILYHFTNIQIPSSELEEFVSSDLPRNPLIWVTNFGSEIYLNDARVLRKDLKVRIGEEQIIHTIDRVLEPTIPNTSVGGSDLNNPDAKKYMENYSLYNITNGFRISEFGTRVAQLNRLTSYNNIGKHTFFIPIDDAFKLNNIKNIDNKILDAHIIPGQAIFLTSAPINRGIQSLTYESVDPSLAYQNFPIYIFFEKLNRTGLESWNIISNSRVDNQISGTRYRRGKVFAEVAKGNIPVRNGVIHLIRKPLALIDTTIYDVVEAHGKAFENGPMMEFFRILNDHARHTGIYELLQRRDGRRLTLFVPSNDAIERTRNLANLVTNRTALTEILRLHIVEQEITMEDLINGSISSVSGIVTAPLEVYSARQDWKIHFTVSRDSQYNTGSGPIITLEGGGTVATILQSDIGATNGVIHLIDRVLGVEDSTIYSKLETIHQLESTFRLGQLDNFNHQFKDESNRFTYFAPSNTAWDKFSTQYPLDHSKLFHGGYSSGNILNRHLIVGQDLTIEELKNISSNYGREHGSRISISTHLGGYIRIASIDDPDYELVREKYGESYGTRSSSSSSSSGSGTAGTYYRRQQYSSGRVYGDYKYVIFWYNKESYVIRPNVKTTNGIIHIIDTPLVTPGDVVAGTNSIHWRNKYLSLFMIGIVTLIFTFD